MLPPTAGANLIVARERAFYVSKAAGADDLVDAVVPRAAIPEYLARVAELAAAHGALVSGCGHVGDGNVHLSVFLPDHRPPATSSTPSSRRRSSSAGRSRVSTGSASRSGRTSSSSRTRSSWRCCGASRRPSTPTASWDPAACSTPAAGAGGVR